MSRQRHERMKNNGDGTRGLSLEYGRKILTRWRGPEKGKEKKNINRHAVTSFSLEKVVG